MTDKQTLSLSYVMVWILFCVAIWPLPNLHFIVALICAHSLLYIGKKSGSTPS